MWSDWVSLVLSEPTKYVPAVQLTWEREQTLFPKRHFFFIKLDRVSRNKLIRNVIKTLIRSRTWQDDLERPKLRKIYMEFGTWKRRETRVHPKFKFGDAKKKLPGLQKAKSVLRRRKAEKIAWRRAGNLYTNRCIDMAFINIPESRSTAQRMPFQAQWLLYVPPSLKTKSSIFFPQGVLLCDYCTWIL